ncbi:MAG: hypothetical protein ACYTGC_13525 [Planctomycetota bacterium]
MALVEAYLHANGYLTAIEFPIVQAIEGGGYRSVTDIDILAVRLPGAGRIVPREGAHAAHEARLFEPDPKLIDKRTDEMVDFLIAEVKEGKAELNRGARDPATLITALRRFTFVPARLADRLVDDLLQKGRAEISDPAVQVRLFAFGSRRDPRKSPPNVILLHQCIEYLVKIGAEFSGVRSASQIRNPTIGMLALLYKTGFASIERHVAPEDEDAS